MEEENMTFTKRRHIVPFSIACLALVGILNNGRLATADDWGQIVMASFMKTG